MRSIGLLAALALSAALSVRASEGASVRTPERPAEIIVRHRSTADLSALAPVHRPSRGRGPLTVSAADLTRAHPASLAALDRRWGVQSAQTVLTAQDRGDVWVLRLGPGIDPLAAAASYEADPNVIYAEPNIVGSLCYIPTDPLWGQTAQDLDLIHLSTAWDTHAGADPSVRVAVIDSGVQSDHPDLVSALDLADSFNFVDGDATVFDDVGHGTRVAGIIAATANNGVGIAGVAFGARVLSLDVADAQGQITAADVASALAWAVAHGAQIANLSLRFTADSRTLREACEAAEAAGVLLIAAAGNENQGDLPTYPASYAPVLGVGAVDDDGATRAPWSNYNGLQTDLVDLVAPGTTVFTTIPGSQFNGSYGSGTSYAAPMVSGVAALLLSENPGQSPQAIRRHLTSTASTVPAGQPSADWAGAGLLDAQVALVTPMAPVIAIQAVSVDDSPALNAANDGDGALDVGETAHLVVSLSSTSADAAGVIATLSTADPDIGPIAQATVPFGAVRSGILTANSASPFGDLVLSGGASAKNIAFALHITGDGGLDETLDFSLPLENETDRTGILFDEHFTSDRTYHVTGGVLDLRGATVIDPGVTFRVDPGVDVRVGEGTLDARGTAEDPILFTSAQPLRTGGRGVGAHGPIGPQNEPVDLGAYQRIRYVDGVNGSDATGDGTQGNPWKTLPFALAQITDATSSRRYAVLIAEGTYADGFIQGKRYVSLFGGFEPTGWTRDIFAHRTVLDGQGTSPILNVDNDSTVDGFVFARGGVHAVYAEGSTGVAISNNVFTDNTQRVLRTNTGTLVRNNAFVNNRCNEVVETFSGPGAQVLGNLFLGNSAAYVFSESFGTNQTVLSDNLFIENASVDNFLPGAGKGILVLQGSPPVIADNTFLGNTALLGGALTMEEGSAPTVLGNLFVANTSGGTGGAILCDGSSPLAANNLLVDNHAAQSGGGLHLLNASPVLRNFTVTRNSAGGPGGGIRVEGTSNPSVTNAIFWDDSTEISLGPGATGSLSYSCVQGGFPGVGNIASDPQLLGVEAWGVVTAMEHDPVRFQTTLLDSEAALEMESLTGQILLLGDGASAERFVVASNTATEIVLWGDATRSGAVNAPQGWRVEDFHLAATSPCIDTGNAATTGVTEDIDGEARPIDTPGVGRDGTGDEFDMGADEHNPASPLTTGSWGRLWVTSAATGASLEHCVVENGAGVLAEIAGVSIADSTVRRSAGHGLQMSVGGPQAVTGVLVEVNRDTGISAPGRDLVACSARANGADGLSAADLTACTATGNGGDGLVGQSASDSSAELNAGDGALLSGDATGVAARGNGGAGIVTTGGDVDACLAAENGGQGIVIQGGGTASNSRASFNGSAGIFTAGSAVTACVAEGNGGFGVAGSGASSVTQSRLLGNVQGALSGVATVADCAVAENGSGVSAATSVMGCYVAQNLGDGISGGAIADCSVVANSGAGIGALTSLDNSWVMANGQLGVHSTEGTGAVTGSTIRDNAGIGVQDVLSATGNNIFDNGPPEARDTSTTGSADRDFTLNFWGAANTALLQASPPFSNMPFLTDVLDGSGTHLINVWPFASGEIATAPSDAPPAFLLSVVPGPDEPLNVGATQITLHFSRAMDTATEPAVTYALTPPFTDHVVDPAPGWTDPTTWQGVTVVNTLTGDGLNTLRVAEAVDGSGFALPDDSAHRFVVDTSGGGTANNGVATSVGTGRMLVTWDAASVPPTTLGFNVARTDTAGATEQINDAALTEMRAVDDGVQALSVYRYTVYRVDSLGGAEDWDTFVGVSAAEGPPIIDVPFPTDQTIPDDHPYVRRPPLRLLQGTSPVTFSAVSVPAGLEVDPETGEITWPNPTAVGSPHTVTVRASNAFGDDDASFTLTVNAVTVAPVIDPIADDTLCEGAPYTGPTPTLSQGTPPITWTLVSGPAGMTIDSGIGVVSWPAAVAAGSPHTVTIRATNSADSDDESWTLTVNQAPLIEEIASQEAVEGVAYTGPTPNLLQGTPPVGWSLVEGPVGMEIAGDTGVVTWPSPAQAGSPHQITLRASNGCGTDDVSWFLTVTEPRVAPVVAPIASTTILVSSEYTGPVPVLTEGTLPVSWSLVAGPPGMTIDLATGVVHWPVAAAAGSPHGVTIRATNAAGDGDASWSVTVLTVPEAVIENMLGRFADDPRLDVNRDGNTDVADLVRSLGGPP